MTELNSPPKIPWSLAKKLALLLMIGVAGVGAAVLGKTAFGTGFGPWMLGSAVVISLAAVAFLWNATPSSDTLRN